MYHTVKSNKKTWMFMCICRPPAPEEQYFLGNLSTILDPYSSIYINHIILADFNMEPRNLILISFRQYLILCDLIKSSTCFEGNGTFINLTFTNRKFCFKHSSLFETYLINHLHLIKSVLKITLKKGPKLDKYCYYLETLKNFMT